MFLKHSLIRLVDMGIEKKVSEYKGRVGVDMISGDRSGSKVLKYTIPALLKVANESSLIYPNVMFVALGPVSELQDYFSGFSNVDVLNIEHTHDNYGRLIDINENPIIEKGEKEKFVTDFSDSKSVLNYLMKLLRQGKIDAAFTSGNTGIVVKNAGRNVGMIDGILKAPLTAIIPTISRNDPSILADVGANFYTTPLMLYQSAVMSNEYYKLICPHSDKEPRVAILNAGEEKTKGTDILFATYELFEKLEEQGKLNFVGFIEGRGGVFQNKADVIVTDGWTGNMAIKVGEGMLYDLMGAVMKEELKGKNIWLRIAGACLKFGDYSSKLKQRVLPDKYNAAPQIGLKKPVAMGHSTSNRFAFAHGIENTIRYAASDLINRLTDVFSDKETVIMLKKKYHEPYIDPMKKKIQEYTARIMSSKLDEEQKKLVLDNFLDVFNRNSLK